MTIAKEPEDERPKWLISASTPVQLGVLLILIGGIFGGGWALSGMNTKLDVVLTMARELVQKNETVQQKLTTHEQDDTRQWTDVKARVLAIETTGSPALRELIKEMAELKARVGVMEKMQKP